MEKIKLDFWSYFDEASSHEKKSDIFIKISRDLQILIPKNLKTTMQTQTSLSYDHGHLRYCDYYGQATSQIDFLKNEIIISGESEEKLHEVAYLVILSRVGKLLDESGIHKLHAFAIEFKEKLIFVCMMPSKGGKSTLLSELLKDSRVKMLSDDIPLVDSHGRIMPFPIKIGFNQYPSELLINEPNENIYTMNRSLHGLKYLVSTRGLVNKIVKDGCFDKIVLAEGFRFNSESFQILDSSWWMTWKGLFKHGIVGIGSPIVIEYFWQSGISDFLVKTKIFFLRLIAFSCLCTRAKKITLLCGKKPEVTAKGVLEYLDKHFKN